MLGQLLAQGTPGGDYNLLNQKRITYGHLLQYIAKHSPTDSKWGVEASQWAEKMHGLFDNIVDIDTWSSVVHDCSLQVSDPFLRKVLQHLQMFTNGIPDGMTYLFVQLSNLCLDDQHYDDSNVKSLLPNLECPSINQGDFSLFLTRLLSTTPDL